MKLSINEKILLLLMIVIGLSIFAHLGVAVYKGTKDSLGRVTVALEKK